jgi:hypothetical protein
MVPGWYVIKKKIQYGYRLVCFKSRYLPIDIGSYPWELCEDTENVHPWWIWGYWISPLSYAQNAITVNEFLAPRWDKVNALQAVLTCNSMCLS